MRALQKSGPSTPTTPSYVAPPLFAQFASYNTPPVPQLPEPYRSPGFPSPASGGDVFHNSIDRSKPLPPIISKGSRPAAGKQPEADLAAPDTSFSSTPDRTIRPRPREGHSRGHGSASSGRRRSASLGDLEWHKVMQDVHESALAPGDLPRSAELGKASTEWDTTGFMSLFRGELSQLDPVSTPALEIRDPSTPQRRPGLNRVRAKTDQTPVETSTIRPRISTSISMPAAPPRAPDAESQRVVLDSPTLKRSPVSPRRSSIALPGESPVRSSAPRRVLTRPSPPVSGSALYASPRTASTPTLGVPTISSPSGKARNVSASPVFTNPFGQQPSVVLNGATASGSRDAGQPRSAELGEEPELGPRLQIPGQTPEFQRTVRLVPSATLFGYASNPQGSASASQVDFGMNDGSPKTVTSASASPGRSMSLEGDEMEARGRELAGRCWMDDVSFLPKEKIAEWLGGA